MNVIAKKMTIFLTHTVQMKPPICPFQTVYFLNFLTHTVQMKLALYRSKEVSPKQLLNPHGSDETHYSTTKSKLYGKVFLTHTVQMKHFSVNFFRNQDKYFLTHTVQMKQCLKMHLQTQTNSFLTHTVQMKHLSIVIISSILMTS